MIFMFVIKFGFWFIDLRLVIWKFKIYLFFGEEKKKKIKILGWSSGYESLAHK